MGNLIASSPSLQHVIKGLSLTQTFFVSSLILGEPHTGKKTIAKQLFLKGYWVDGENQKATIEALKNYDEIIIYNYNANLQFTQQDFAGKRVVAIANMSEKTPNFDNLFGFIYIIPPLSQRPEDVTLLSEHYANEAKKLFGSDTETTLNPERFDISQNNKTLMQSVYSQVFASKLSSDDIEDILRTYLYKNLAKNNGYKELLPIFEKPLLEAGLAKYHSQLQLASILGINRNTLRKKIYELNID